MNTQLPAGCVVPRPRRVSLRRCLRVTVALVVALAASAFAPGPPGTPGGPDPASAVASPTGSLPSPRSRTSAVWANGSAYIFGGRTGAPSQGYSNTRQIVKFTPGAGSTVVGQLPPTPKFSGCQGLDGREDTSAIWDGSNAYIFGGYDRSGFPVDEIVRFNPATLEARVVARLPRPTAGAGVAWDGESAYLFGGYVLPSQPSQPPPPPGCQGFPNPGPPPQLSDQIVRFTPDANGGRATTLSTTLPTPRNHSAAVYENPYIHVYGGHTGQDATDEILSFAPIDGTFDEYRARLPSPRHDASAFWLPGPAGEGIAYIFGGAASSLDDNATNEIVAHDPVQGAGSAEVVDRLPGGRAHVSAVASDAVGGYLFGGESGPGGRDLSAEILRFTRPVRYVALGDSYSSGEGLGEDSAYPPYLEGGSPDCHRHRYAYPKLFEFNGPTQLDFFACTGARTEHIYRDAQQERPGESGLPQAYNPEVNSRTDLVTMTIGGNDIGEPDDEGNGGLGDVLRDCYRTTNCHEDAEFVALIESRLTELGEKLRSSIRTVKEQTGPDTAIFVLGYPRAFPTDDDPQQQSEEQDCDAFDGTFLVGDGWTTSEQPFLNAATDRLNGLSNDVAAAEGVRFIDVTERFTGHAPCDEPENDYCSPERIDETTPYICEEGEDWINALTDFSPPTDYNEGPGSFHPNLAGQFAYRDALRGYIDLVIYFIRNGIIPGRLTPIGLPANPGSEPPPPEECDPGVRGGVDPCMPGTTN